MSVFFLPLNELGLLPANKLPGETVEMLARVSGFLRSVQPQVCHEETHASSCSVSSLICCELCTFLYMSTVSCAVYLFPSLSSSPLPPLPSRLMLDLLLRLPPNTIHPLPPLPCLQEFVPHYRSLLHPNQPFHPAWCQSFAIALSHYLHRHQRYGALWDIRHSHSVRGLGDTEVTGD